MSSRIIKKDKIVFVGLPKNGSQAIKQIALRNDGFEIREFVNKPGWNDDKFLDFYDEDLTIFFPIRNSHTRARSELLETSKNYSGEDLISHIKNTISNGFTLNPRLSYFKNDIMLFFLKNILPNEKWKGCKIKFFDLKKLTTHIPEYIGLDIEIPYYNVASKDIKKEEIKKEFCRLNDEKPFEKVLVNTSELEESLLTGIKKSKFWIHL